MKIILINLGFENIACRKTYNSLTTFAVRFWKLQQIYEYICRSYKSYIVVEVIWKYKLRYKINELFFVNLLSRNRS